MNRPRPAQLDLLLTISEGLSRGAYEMLRVSPTDALHPPSCGLAIRDAVEELKWMRAEIKRLHQAHQAACEGGDLLREELAKVFEEGREAGWADCRYEPGSENPYLDTKDRKWSNLP